MATSFPCVADINSRTQLREQLWNATGSRADITRRNVSSEGIPLGSSSTVRGHSSRSLANWTMSLHPSAKPMTAHDADHHDILQLVPPGPLDP